MKIGTCAYCYAFTLCLKHRVGGVKVLRCPACTLIVKEYLND